MANQSEAGLVRNTFILETKKNKFKIEIRDYMTGRENRQVKNAMWEGKSMQIKDGKGESDKVEMTRMEASTDKTIEIMIVSINGVTENVVELFKDLPTHDYDEALEKIEEITKPEKTEKKENGKSSTKD